MPVCVPEAAAFALVEKVEGVTNRTQTARQDVTQIAPNKLEFWDGLVLEAVGVTGVIVSERIGIVPVAQRTVPMGGGS